MAPLQPESVHHSAAMQAHMAQTAVALLVSAVPNAWPHITHSVLQGLLSTGHTHPWVLAQCAREVERAGGVAASLLQLAQASGCPATLRIVQDLQGHEQHQQQQHGRTGSGHVHAGGPPSSATDRVAAATDLRVATDTSAATAVSEDGGGAGFGTLSGLGDDQDTPAGTEVSVVAPQGQRSAAAVASSFIMRGPEANPQSAAVHKQTTSRSSGSHTPLARATTCGEEGGPLGKLLPETSPDSASWPTDSVVATTLPFSEAAYREWHQRRSFVYGNHFFAIIFVLVVLISVRQVLGGRAREAWASAVLLPCFAVRVFGAWRHPCWFERHSEATNTAWQVLRIFAKVATVFFDAPFLGRPPLPYLMFADCLMEGILPVVCAQVCLSGFREDWMSRLGLGRVIERPTLVSNCTEPASCCDQNTSSRKEGV